MNTTVPNAITTHDDDDDDDSSVEYMGTKFVEAAATGPPEVVPEDSTAIVTPPLQPPPLHHSDRYRTSIYVQNLAEICWTILQDRRWNIVPIPSCSPISSSPPRKRHRTTTTTTTTTKNHTDDVPAAPDLHHLHHTATPTTQPLFQWELGDDCKAVHLFSRLYHHHHHQDPTTTTATTPAAPTTTIHHHTDRKYYLYSRLYYRKGPWFRIDDIYQKYYRPRDSQTTTTTPSHTDEDATVLQPCLDLLQDLYELHQAGLIRFFHSEMECGQTIGGGGPTSASASASLLTVEEQQTILSKLGGGGQPKNPRTSHGTNRQPRTNRIWQQMRQQTSIRSFCSAASTTPTKVLPVRHHVEALLRDQLVHAVARNHHDDASHDASTRRRHANRNTTTTTTRDPPPLRHLYHVIRQHIQNIFCSTDRVDGSHHLEDPTTTNIGCFRLCESPVLTLRRCARLYVCATSGPGVMRSTPQNGLRSCCFDEGRDPDPSPHRRSHPPTTTRTSGTTATTIEPPQSWHHVQYPIMSYCFGFTSAPYYNAYQPLPLVNSSGDSFVNHNKADHSFRPKSGTTMFPPEQVFPTHIDFRRWETYVELRCLVDYLLECNDRYRSEERKRQSAAPNRHETATPDESSTTAPAPSRRTSGKVTPPTADATTTTTIGHFDDMGLLTAHGRIDLLKHFVSPPSQFVLLYDDMERAVSDSSTTTKFVGAYEQVLGVIGIIVIRILTFHDPQHCRNQESPCVISLQERPWLRHMSWLAGLALIVFDVIPVLERRGLHFLAIQSLQVLLYGSFSIGTETSLNRAALLDQLLHQQRTCSHPSWISRRARGKAIVRLIIDCGQIPLDQSRDDMANDKVKAKMKKETSDASGILMVRFCHDFIADAAMSGCVGFSVIRTLARRLKQPLKQTLNPLRCVESVELGIRLSNLDGVSVSSAADKKGYSDWTPVTDYFVANSISRDKIEPGGRCAFIGFEDDINNSILSSSLNVEELAMDLYRTGRLPTCNDDCSDPKLKGGWTGWHNEGAMIKALFRVICGGQLLRMDFGNISDTKRNVHLSNYATIHLSPYQQGPFHLLVGYELQKTRISTHDDENLYTPTPSFYCQCADNLAQFLARLSTTNGQELCDMVYDAVASRQEHARLNNRKDPFLALDIIQVRTYSALAAGFGGKCLAAMFRCFLFDYRHYSGGLPDLHLFRAVYSCETTHRSERAFVELGGWIGESFSMDRQQSFDYQRVLHALADDEFLGLDKPNSRPTRTKLPVQPSEESVLNTLSIDMLPERLQLCHNDCLVEVECLMVEVKSSNDRLDPRQEDWLNVIDLHGNARVCKFVDSEKSRNCEVKIKSMP